MDKIRFTAHLVVRMGIPKDSHEPYPTFLGVEIFSASPENLTIIPGEFGAEVTSATGDSYEQAKAAVIDTVRRTPLWSWMLPWIEEGRDAHNYRYYLNETVKMRNVAIARLKLNKPSA